MYYQFLPTQKGVDAYAGMNVPFLFHVSCLTYNIYSRVVVPIVSAGDVFTAGAVVSGTGT